MGKVGSNTGGVDNIVEGELINERAGLKEERKRLGEKACQQLCEPGWTAEARKFSSYLTNAARGTSNNCANETLASSSQKITKKELLNTGKQLLGENAETGPMRGFLWADSPALTIVKGRGS